ncbi:uncharacterized protein LOC117124861 [Anneissia japonica]|uniref:uncharacterized protein LOC117124861 n=1 Tax=Anneissia japonica TaxID=1529436 RepID=UPI0014258601|nr:uncharacterized protein LOC117124861 [Anneissia japonica]
MAVGNLLLAASVLFTGNTFTTLQEICENMKLTIMTERDFYLIQRKFLLPSVNQMWEFHQQEILKDYSTKINLTLAGDARCDSPSHSATFGTYSLMDCEKNIILTTNVVKVTEVKNLYHLENEGMIRSLKQLERAGVKVTTLATDRHPQVTKTLREKFGNINHQFDVWHIGKSLTKKLSAAAKRKECADFQPWVKSIITHFWWCADTCQGSETQLKQKAILADEVDHQKQMQYKNMSPDLEML